MRLIVFILTCYIVNEFGGVGQKMKKSFYASACIQGIHGGAIKLTDDAFYFVCQKITIPNDYKMLKIPYENIELISYHMFALIFPIVKIKVKTGKKYKFVIFNKRKFQRCINELNDSDLR